MTMNSLEIKLMKLQFSGKMRLAVYRKLVRFLRNSVPLPTALDTIYTHASYDGRKPKAVQAFVVDHWRRAVRNGHPFGRAIAGWVPDKDRLVIEAGEKAGRLDVALENAIFIEEGSKEIRGALFVGLSYPVVLLMMTLGFMILFSVEVVPAFADVVPREKWDGAAANLAFMADFVNGYLAYALAALGAIVIVILWSMPRLTGRLRVFLDRVPPWSLYRLVNGVGFMLSLAALVKSGKAMPDTLRVMMRGASPWYYERISRTLFHLNNGAKNVGEALYRTGLEFPDRETVNDLRAYAGLEGFEDALTKIAREGMIDTVAKIKAQSAIMRNVGIIAFGIVLMTIVSGIFALQTIVTTSAGT